MSTRLFISLVFFLTMFHFGHFADPDPVQDYCIAKDPDNYKNYVNGYPCKDPENVTSDDFRSTYLRRPVDTNTVYGADPQLEDVTKFPGLNFQGVSIARIYYEPWGLNVPHNHPRSSEVLCMQSGKVYAALVTTEYKLLEKLLEPGDCFVFPRGLVHWQYNSFNESALSYAAFNSQKPGRTNVAESLYNTTPSVEDEVLSKTFMVNEKLIEKIKMAFNRSSV